MSACPVDFADRKVQVCPFDAYRELRSDHPVYLDPTTGFYVVLDYALLREIGMDTKRFSSSTGVLVVRSGELGKQLQKVQEEHGVPPVPVLIVTDPPLHGFHRALVDRAFGLPRVKKLEAYLTQVVDDLIDRIVDRSPIDFVSEFAVTVPVSVLTDLMGVPRSQMSEIKRWADASSAAADPSKDTETKVRLTRIVCEFQRYVAGLAKEYREKPNDSVLSDLANADVDGRKLTENELVAICQQIMVAGHETTTRTMAGALLWMINTPGLEQRLRDNPDLISNFIEEVLRLEAPLQGMFRMTTTDVELGGVKIPAKSVVVVRWGAGNRDPKRFDSADALDIDRVNVKQHLAFGAGPHFCVGNQLARSELRISFDRLLRRMKNFRLVAGDGSVVREPHYFIYGIGELHIEFDGIA